MPDQRGAARQFREQGMKAGVHRDVGRECFHRDRILRDQLVQFREALFQRLKIARRHPSLGSEPRGKTFEHPAQLDRIENVAFGERLHHEPAGGNRFQKAFLFEPDQCHPHRRSRHAGRLDRPELRNSLTGPQSTGKDQIA